MKFSVVTPSYNQGQFLEQTIQSVLSQGYPNLEYIIIDGGSTDNSVEIIRKYERHLAYWVSEKDNGQAHALNKGFRQATGELIGWQNSDDYYHPQAFEHAALAAARLPECDIFYGPTDYVDAEGQFIRPFSVSPFDICSMFPHSNMSNQAMFFRRRIFDEGNFIDETFRHAMDYEFFVRLIAKQYRFELVEGLVGYYRLHAAAKTITQEDIGGEESNCVHWMIYQNPKFPARARHLALHHLQGFCQVKYGAHDPAMFRILVERLIARAGLSALTPSLALRYLVSLFGPRSIWAARQFKHILLHQQ